MPRTLALTISILAVSIAFAAAAPAVTWDEVGDAGPVPGSAQIVPNGGASLTEITGAITQSPTDVPVNDLSGAGASVADVDLYRIYISNPSGFSAETENGDSIDSDLEFDAVLALFDENGFGVYRNDDRVFDDGNARLPAGHPNGPTSAGIYYLAIYDDNVTALSALSLNGPIFPEVGSPYTQVVGPTGPGGAGALIDWFPDAPIDASRSYSIFLTGVTTVPEPGTLALASAALLTVLGVSTGRRR